MLKEYIVPCLCCLILAAGCGDEDTTGATNRLMQVKWDENGRAMYMQNSDSTSVPLLWNKINVPLKYCLYFSSSNMMYYGSIVDNVAAMWNEEIGCRVLEASSDLNCAINITISLPLDDASSNSYVTHYGGPLFASTADIVLTQSLPKDIFYTTVAHQFGHALGLRDDNFSDWATMSPEIESTEDASINITSSDNVIVGKFGHPFLATADINALEYLCN